MLKKIVAFFVVLTMTLTIVIATGSDYNKDNIRKMNEQKAVEQHNRIIGHFIEKYNTEQPDIYSGAFIDNDGNLNINLVDSDFESNKKALSNLLSDNTIIYHKVKHSLNNLDCVIELLSAKMHEYDIQMISRDEQNGKVNIFIEGISDDKILRIMEFVNKPFLEFKKGISEIKFTASDLMNGCMLSASTSFSLGLGAKQNGTTIGYLIPGHVSASVGTTVTYNGTTIGTISQKVLSGSADVSFVTKSGTTYQPSKLLNGFTLVNGRTTQDSYTRVNTMSSYAQNSTVYKWGSGSGKSSGTIVSNNVSIVSEDDVILTNIVQATYSAISGDSGGPVGYRNNELLNMNEYSIIGLHSATNSTHSFFTKILYDLNSINAAPYPQ